MIILMILTILRLVVLITIVHVSGLLEIGGAAVSECYLQFGGKHLSNISEA